MLIVLQVSSQSNQLNSYVILMKEAKFSDSVRFPWEIHRYSNTVPRYTSVPDILLKWKK